MQRRFVHILAILLTTASLLSAQTTRPEVPDVIVKERLDNQLPLDLKFTDDTGAAVTLRDCMLDGKPMILQLSYFGCPMLCDMVSKGMLNSVEDLDLDIGRDFTVVNMSFDPKETRNEAFLKKRGFLQHYTRSGAATGWHFLVGEQSAVKAIADAVGFPYSWDEQTKQFAHPAVLMIITPSGRVSRYLYGVQFPQQTLRLSLVEASAGKIGSIGDQITMLCFKYDSSVGKYTFAAMGLMRTGGVLTVLALGTIVIRMLIKERRAQRATGPATDAPGPVTI